MPAHHPTAIIAKNAEIASNVTIAPYAIIEANVKIGKGTQIGAYTVIKSGTTIGEDNVFHENVVIGGTPQDLSFAPKQASFVTIGEGNTFREYVSVHRSATAGNATQIGCHNLFMCGAHIAHDVVIGSRVVLANVALLAGHVSVDDHAFISGNVVIHQHARIGKYAMLSGLIRVSADAPPFALVSGFRASFVGVNVVGLRRAQLPPSYRLAIKGFYHHFYESTQRETFLAEQAAKNPLEPIREIITFIRASKRGLLKHRHAVLTETQADEKLL